MTIDARDMSYTDIFNELRKSAPDFYSQGEECLVFVDAHDMDKSIIIQEFIRRLWSCDSTLIESNGFYIVRVLQNSETAAVNEQCA